MGFEKKKQSELPDAVPQHLGPKVGRSGPAAVLS